MFSGLGTGFSSGGLESGVFDYADASPVFGGGVAASSPGVDFGGILRDLPIGDFIGRLLSGKRDINREIPANAALMQAMQDAGVYSRASADPNSPYYKNLQAVLQQRGLRELREAINSVMRAQNRAVASGKMGILAIPDRRDESLARALARGRQDVYNQSGEQASSALLRAAQGITGTAGGLSAAQAPQQRISQLNYSASQGLIEGINKALRNNVNFDALFGGGKPQQQTAQPAYVAPQGALGQQQSRPAMPYYGPGSENWGIAYV